MKHYTEVYKLNLIEVNIHQKCCCCKKKWMNDKFYNYILFLNKQSADGFFFKWELMKRVHLILKLLTYDQNTCKRGQLDMCVLN